MKLLNIREHKQVKKIVLKNVKALCQRFDLDYDEYDIYAELVNGNAALFMNKDGFLVLRDDVDCYTKEKVLFVWVAYAFVRGKQFLKEPKYQEWLAQKAKAIGATKIRFETTRKGYEKQLGENWRCTSLIYEKVL